jgi:hypothetical protein
MVRGDMRIYRPQWMTQVLWEATDPGWDGVLRVLTAGFLRRPRRLAYCCPGCEAYVIAPVDAPTTAPAPGSDGRS